MTETATYPREKAHNIKIESGIRGAALRRVQEKDLCEKVRTIFSMIDCQLIHPSRQLCAGREA
ncbi:MAG: hypothetical protein V4634_01850 [Pseudomonadota bacterium]